MMITTLGCDAPWARWRALPPLNQPGALVDAEEQKKGERVPHKAHMSDLYRCNPSLEEGENSSGRALNHVSLILL
jgi:hypothetical protein